MDKEDIKRLAGNPEFISGIYNYCDRWCQRCPFTSRCMNWAVVNEQFPGQESHDVNNETFWRRLSATFRLTLDLLKEAAEREGIDLDAVDTETDADQDRLNDETAGNHECCLMAKAYAEIVDDWFNSVQRASAQKEDDLDFKACMETPIVGPFGETDTCEDAVEVIRWYQHQIWVKLMRAIRGMLEEEFESVDEFAKDTDGSAKVALIAIDRSIAAWEEMRTSFLAYDREILHMLIHLERMRRKAEEVFPRARAFIRPGFDKIDLNS